MKSPLRDIRIMRGLTQAELAAAVGVSQATVSRWESSTSAPQAAERPKIEAVLRLDEGDVCRVAVQAWRAGR